MCVWLYMHVCTYIHMWGFSGGSVIKNLLAVQEMWVPSLGWEDPLKKKMATHSSIFAGKSHG